MYRLLVKNFGPLKDIDIELNKINLFIGENGSGKSVLAKLITICFDIINNVYEKETLNDKFNDFGINFINKNTYINLTIGSKQLFSLEIENNSNKSNGIIPKIVNYYTIESKYLLDEIKVLEEIINKYNKLIEIESNDREKEKRKKEKKKYISELEERKNRLDYVKKINDLSNTLSSKYIPAERNFISLVNKSLASLIVADIPLPKFLLQFASDFEKATNDIKELEALGVKYINSDGLDRHKVYFNDNEYLPLEQSSSGIQSAIPLYLTFKYFTKQHSTIVVEEPEQNLFPKAQKETVEFLIENIKDKDGNLFMMTHSPYILSSLNNLILAYDVKEKNGVKAIENLVKDSQTVAFEDVSVYYLQDGKAVDIKDYENRLIGINEIDSISDEVAEIFDKLLDNLD